MAKPLVENEAFVNMLATALDDEAIRNRLIRILEQESFQRQSLINTFTTELMLKKAPRDFIGALSSLADDKIAAQALAVLRKGGP